MNKLWWLVLLLLVLAAALLVISLRQRQKSGLPQAAVLLYADTDLWQRVPQTLVDHQLGLVGKPDYIMRTRQGSLIPVEVKTGHTPEVPYDSHRLQLMAYGKLIQSNYAQMPEYGLLHYPQKDFRVDFTPELEAQLLETLENIQQIEVANLVPNRSHNSSARCRSCGYRDVCDQKLI